MNAIVAVDRRLGIGRDNGLLVHIPGDLKYFREKTKGKCVVMGRKTLESLPGGRPLPGRDHIILTRDENFVCPEREGAKCRICRSREEALDIISKDYSDDDVFLCGGASIYEEFFDDCDRYYVTHIDGDFDADRFFPPLTGLEEVSRSEDIEENGYTYRFCVYERR